MIEKWAYNYNRRNKDSDRNIHFVQLIEDSEEIQPSGNSVLIHIDFGNCDMLLIRNVIPVSYTHLTLPTICSV